jgi:hypothetical protein
MHLPPPFLTQLWHLTPRRDETRPQGLGAAIVTEFVRGLLLIAESLAPERL